MGFYDDLNNARVDSLRSTFNDNKDRLLQHVQKRYKEDFINGTDISTIYIFEIMEPNLFTLMSLRTEDALNFLRAEFGKEFRITAKRSTVGYSAWNIYIQVIKDPPVQIQELSKTSRRGTWITEKAKDIVIGGLVLTAIALLVLVLLLIG